MKRDKTTRSEQWVRNIVIEVLLYNKTLSNTGLEIETNGVITL